MQPELVTAFAVFAAVAAGTPGPANVLIAATAANVGIVRALPCLLGVAVGTGALLGCVAFGLGAILLDRPAILAAMNWIGAGLLLWLAWKIATAAGDGGSERRERPVGFLGAAALQWVNPKSWLVSASAAGTYLSAAGGEAWLQATTFGLLFVLVAIPACSVWLLFGAAMGRLLRSKRARRTFNAAMGALLGASVVLLFV